MTAKCEDMFVLCNDYQMTTTADQALGNHVDTMTLPSDPTHWADEASGHRGQRGDYSWARQHGPQLWTMWL